MSKKYKLLRDLPGVYHGAIYTQGNQNPDYYNTDGKSYYDRVYKDIVENSGWFELIPERIEVIILPDHSNKILERVKVEEGKPDTRFIYIYTLYSTSEIPVDKRESIKKAIEFVLNGEKVSEPQFEQFIGKGPTVLNQYQSNPNKY